MRCSTKQYDGLLKIIRDSDQTMQQLLERLSPVAEGWGGILCIDAI